jgi:hypothetical protein
MKSDAKVAAFSRTMTRLQTSTLTPPTTCGTKVLAPANLLQIIARFIHLEIKTDEDWDGLKTKNEKGNADLSLLSPVGSGNSRHGFIG